MSQNFRMVFAVLLVALVIGAIGPYIDAAGPNDVDSLLMKVAKPSRGVGLPLPFYATASPDPYPTGPGPVHLVLRVVAKHPCSEVSYRILTVDNLTVLGNGDGLLSVVPNDTNYLPLEVDIPPNDTSGLVVEFTSNVGHKAKLPIYFVSGLKGVEFYLLYRDGFRQSSPSENRGHSGIPDSLFWEEKNPKGPRLVRTGQFDMEGNFVQQDSIIDGVALDGRRVGSFDTIGNFIATDSILREAAFLQESRRLSDSVRSLPGGPEEWAIVVDSGGNQYIVSRQYLIDSSQAYLQHLYDSVKAAEVQAEIAEMREMEKTPLTDRDAQFFSIGDKLYHRGKGEYKFQEAVRVHDRAAPFAARRDSILWRDKPEGPWDCLLDLRDPKDYEFTRAIVDSLLDAEGVGIYRATLTLEQRLKLEQQGIRVLPAPKRPKLR